MNTSLSAKYNKHLKHCHFVWKYAALGENYMTNICSPQLCLMLYLTCDFHLKLYISHKLVPVLWIINYKYICLSVLINIAMYIKTHGHVAVGKKAMWCTSVLFTGTINLPFSTPSISITTGLIYIKFIHFMPSIYILYPPYMWPYIVNLKKISPAVYKICVP